MQTQNAFSRSGKFTVTGLINPKDNEATKKKAEQLALDCSFGTCPFSQDGSFSHILPSVFEPLSDSKPGLEGDPAKSVAVNTPAVEL